MQQVLVVSVGGACQPIVTAVTDYRAKFVYFLASQGPRGSRATIDGNGKPCKGRDEEFPNIVTQAGLAAGTYEIIEIGDPDSLQECYAAARMVVNRAAAAFPHASFIADYTGGTKSMTVGLALAALEAKDWKLSLVKRAGTDLVRVVDGTE